jgi:hypothetical protein
VVKSRESGPLPSSASGVSRPSEFVRTPCKMSHGAH